MPFRLLFTYAMLMLCVVLTTESTGQSGVYGKILDAKNDPVPFGTVALVRVSDSTVVKGTNTNADGDYSFEKIETGTYRLKTSSMEFNPAVTGPFFLDTNTNYQHPEITMTLRKNTLEEVAVTAQKKTFEFKNGNITVNIENSPLAIGNTVYDLLGRMPGVMIDNTGITILGKQGVSIYIDDRIQQVSGNQLISLLKSMNASSVEKIEIIKNPSAKYDAAGSAGIINIKTKKTKVTGFSGSAGYTLSKGHGVQHLPDLSLNYKGQKISVFNSLSLYHGYLKATDELHKTITYNGTSTLLDSKSVDIDEGKFGIANTSVDWFIDKKNTVGLKYQGIFGTVMRVKEGNSALSDNSEGYQNLYIKRTVPNNFYAANYNLNYEHLFDTLGTRLKMSTDVYGPNYDIFKSDYNYRFEDKEGAEVQQQQNYKAYNRQDLGILSSRIDLEKKLGKTLNFEAGIKASYLDIGSDYYFKKRDNQSGLYITDSAFSNQFNYRERIGAAYVNVQKEIKKLSLQFGLRAEDTKVNTLSEIKDFELSRRYFKLFPSMNLNYTRSDNHNFSFSYNRRIWRPDYNSFNPYYIFNSVYSINTGNPYLLPSFTNNFEISHTFKGKITNSFSYSRELDPIRPQTLQVDSSKVTIFKNGNLRVSNEMRYHIFVNAEIKKWWSVMLNLGAYYFDFKGKVDGGDLNTVGYSYSGYINNQILLPKNFKFELSGWFVGPWLWGGLHKIQPRGALNLALKKTFLSDKLTCSIALYDVFFTGIGVTNINFQNQNIHMRDTYDSRRLNLSVVYNFGKLKVERRSVKSDEDAKARLKR